MADISPAGLQRLARKRYRKATGYDWADATHDERREWLAHVLPILCAEHGIPAGAVWRDNAWQAPQVSLFEHALTGGLPGQGKGSATWAALGQAGEVA